jgi:hypothetical protein
MATSETFIFLTHGRKTDTEPLTRLPSENGVRSALSIVALCEPRRLVVHTVPWHSRARKENTLARSRSPDVKRQAILLARWAGRGAFKATALVFAFVIIVALWLWNASLLTTAADENLRIIKTLTHLLPSDWASKAESAFRIFGADRACCWWRASRSPSSSCSRLYIPSAGGDNVQHLRVRAGLACRAEAKSFGALARSRPLGSLLTRRWRETDSNRRSRRE